MTNSNLILILNLSQDYINQYENGESFMLVPERRQKTVENRTGSLFETQVCLWDTYEFNHQSCSIPIKRINRNGETNYECFGIFCSYDCAYSYLIHDRTGIYNTTSSLSLLKQMFYNEFGEHAEFHDKPHRSILEKYKKGGLTIDEYRKSCFNSRDRLSSFDPPLPIINDAFSKTWHT